MLSPHRIAFCTAEVGAGHTRAGLAVAAALREISPDARIDHVDALAHAPAWFGRGYRDGYLAATRRFPRLAGMLYNRLDRSPPGEAGGPLSAAIERRALTRFVALEKVGSAQALVCSHFLCGRVLIAARARGLITGRLCVIVTDQHPHAIWQAPGVDLYLVGNTLAQATLRRRGVPPDRIRVTGIPIDPWFEKQLPRHEARARHSLPRDGPVILVSGGGLGLGGLDRVVHGLLASQTPAHTVVVCGRNAELKARLDAMLRVHPRRDRVHIVGVTPLMHELMAAADLMVGKPGGLTTAEALSLALPMVLTRPIPGQEERNAQLLVSAGAAVLQPDPAAAGALAAQLVTAQSRLKSMADQARTLGRADSARAAAAAVLELLSALPEATVAAAP